MYHSCDDFHKSSQQHDSGAVVVNLTYYTLPKTLCITRYFGLSEWERIFEQAVNADEESTMLC